jgi:hypothetical protein
MRNKLPKSFDDIIVEQYQYCHSVLSVNQDVDSWVKILSFFTSIPVSKFEEMDMTKLTQLIEHVKFIVKPASITKIEEVILVNNQTYKGIVDITKGKFGQYASLKDELSKTKKDLNGNMDWIPVLHKILGCIYTPVSLFGKDYDMVKCQEDMKKARCGQVFGVVFYYSKVLKRLTPIINDYLDQVEKYLQEQEKNSQKSMVGT